MCWCEIRLILDDLIICNFFLSYVLRTVSVSSEMLDKLTSPHPRGLTHYLYPERNWAQLGSVTVVAQRWMKWVSQRE